MNFIFNKFYQYDYATNLKKHYFYQDKKFFIIYLVQKVY